MISLQQFAVVAGLFPTELVLGQSPSAKQGSLLKSYLMNLRLGPGAVREMMVTDLRSWLDLGASRQTADLLIVLRTFLFDFHSVKCMRL
jgi:hypothetical protein